jgi:glyoxalase family protein
MPPTINPYLGPEIKPGRDRYGSRTRERRQMKLEGIHHITLITGDAPRNVDFYTRVLGLRLVKKTVNQDDPTVYHLFYADEKGSAGADITFFEYPGSRPGRAGAGMVHRITWRVASTEALDFWEERLRAESVSALERTDGRLRFEDPEGMGLELAVVENDDEPLVAEHPEIPSELALQGFDSVRAYAQSPEASRRFLEEGLSFDARGETNWEVRGEQRGGLYAYDPPPAEPGIPGAGTVHHVAWASPMDDHEEWRRRALEAGARPTPVIDRFYFRSIYFREPSGVLFEIATLGPGFATDEPAEHLGERLSLPPDFEHLREQLEPVLTPLPNPREAWTRR